MIWKTYIRFKNLYVYFLKIASRTQENEKLCLWRYLQENNQVQQLVKVMTSSTYYTQLRNLSGPKCQKKVFFLEWNNMKHG